MLTLVLRWLTSPRFPIESNWFKNMFEAATIIVGEGVILHLSDNNIGGRTKLKKKYLSAFHTIFIGISSTYYSI